MIPTFEVPEDAPLDWVGAFSRDTNNLVTSIAVEFVRNGESYQMAMRYAVDEALDGEFYEDLSE